jgi:bacterial/archaeal transporter family-2 protein
LVLDPAGFFFFPSTDSGVAASAARSLPPQPFRCSGNLPQSRRTDRRGDSFAPFHGSEKPMIALYLFAVMAGAFSTALSGSNATLSKDLAQPITAGLIVQVVTIVALIAIGAFHGGMRWPEAGKLAALPWWAWLGGLGGASVLLAQLFVAREIGAAPYLAITVTAGIIVSIAMDHFGWLGFERVAAQWTRLAGGGLMVAGVVLVARN